MTNSHIFPVDGSQSQTYSDLLIPSLHSSQSLNSVGNPFQQQQQQQSVITDLDETIKSTPLQQLHVAKEIVERYDEGVFDDGAGSQTEDENNSVVIADSDDEDDIEHFTSTDSIILNIDHNNQRQLNEHYLTDIKSNQNGQTNSSNTSIEDLKVNLSRSKNRSISI